MMKVIRVSVVSRVPVQLKPGEDVRAGRWWWEQPDQKECGLHKR